jgi:ABC-type transport system involved in multi-copper enzyme maturation permease subunit
MSERHNVEDRRAQAVAPRAWWVVCSRELRDIWIGGKALYLILIYTLLLGVYAFLLASNGEVNLISVKEVMAEMVRAGIACGLFISLIIAADSFSGERERLTLEGLLLTPASRRQLVLGKFLAALSPWPVALAIAIPYWVLMAKGEQHILWLGLVWGSVLGTLLAPGIVAFGMLISIWCNSNKTSMLVSVCFYVAMVLPNEIMAGPAKIQRTAEQWFRAEVNYWILPMSAAFRFQWKILVIGDAPADLWMWHITPALLTVGAVGLLFFYAAPRVRFEAETARRLRAFWERRRRVARVPVPQPAMSENGREDQAALVPVPVKSHRMRVRPRSNESQGKPSGAWWLVFKKELRDLWIGGRAMYLTLVYTIVIGGYTYVMAQDSILSLIPPKEMVYEVTKAAISACVFVGLIIGADSLSGERERSTLEGLLLTPTSRRQIVVGKFLAATSLWPVAFLITIPYLKILSQGDEVFATALFWGPIVGTILAPGFTALGMFVGFWCNSNKTSLFVILCI